jgi:hypothetical protein
MVNLACKAVSRFQDVRLAQTNKRTIAAMAKTNAANRNLKPGFIV